MPVIINDFEVINDDTRQDTTQQSAPPASAQPAHGTTPRPVSLARRLRRLQARRARLHAD